MILEQKIFTYYPRIILLVHLVLNSANRWRLKRIILRFASPNGPLDVHITLMDNRERIQNVVGM